MSVEGGTTLKVTDESLAQAARVIRDGGLVVIPTDTVYGCLLYTSCKAQACSAGILATAKPMTRPITMAQVSRSCPATSKPMNTMATMKLTICEAFDCLAAVSYTHLDVYKRQE